MSLWIKTEKYHLGLQERAEAAEAEASLPVPSQVLSNGEFNPSPQNDVQRKVKSHILAEAEALAKKNNVSRRSFLRSAPSGQQIHRRECRSPRPLHRRHGPHTLPQSHFRTGSGTHTAAVHA